MKRNIILLIIVLSLIIGVFAGCGHEIQPPIETLPAEANIITPEPTVEPLPTAAPIIETTPIPLEPLTPQEQFASESKEIIEDYKNEENIEFIFDEENFIAVVIFTLTDGEMQGLYQSDKPFEEILPNMVGEILTNRLVYTMQAKEVIVCLKNNDQIFIALNILNNELKTDYMNVAVG